MRTMNTTRLKLISIVVSGVSFIVTACSALTFQYLIPWLGTGSFAGVSAGTWAAVHNYSGLVLIGATVFNLAVNWEWIRNYRTLFKRSGGKDATINSMHGTDN